MTSAYDVALMSRALIAHERIFDYTQIWMDSVRGGETQLVNTNKLLKTYNGITGLKTGTTGKAGSCISATAERNGLGLIAVVLGCSSTKDRFDSAAQLLDMGFAGWERVTVSLPELPLVPVVNGMQGDVETKSSEKGELSVLIPKGKQEEITTELSLPESVRAPVDEGQKLGEAVFRLGEETLLEVPVLCCMPVEALDWQKCFWQLLCELIYFG